MSINADEGSLRWFKSYLTGRKHATKFANANSMPFSINTGVPQGSLLGLTLFNIYINSLLELLPEDGSVAYADNITLVWCGTDIVQTIDNMQHLLDLVHNWACKNHLVINVSKCYSMFLLGKKSSEDVIILLSIGRCPIVRVDELKILGVIFTSSFDWTIRSNAVRTKVNRMAGVLRRFSSSLNCTTRLRIFHAFILLHVKYCLLQSHCKAFDNTIRRCAQLIQRNPRATLNSQTFINTGMLSFKQLVCFSNAVSAFNIISRNEIDFYLHTDLFAKTSHSSRQTTGRKCGQ